jgi:hypothetical protein
MKTEQINGAAGLRNDIDTERFGVGDLLVGSNIDLDETGRVSRRAGTSVVSAGMTHSLWSNEKLALFIRGNTLHRLHPNGQEEAIYQYLYEPTPFADVNGEAFGANSKSAIVVDEGGNVRQWGIEPPRFSDLPTPAEIPGALPAGSYGVTMTYVRRDGRESGAPRAVYGSGLGLRLEGLPVSPDPNVTHKRIYITRPDGEVFFAAGQIRNAVTSMSITDLPQDTIQLRTQFKTRAPYGRVVGFFGGRTIVADGPHLFYSDVYEFELFDLRTNFISFDANVTLFAPVNGGAFVGTEKEISFLAGRDITQVERAIVANYGAVLGTLSYVDGDQLLKGEQQGDVAVWMTARGICAGTDDGTFINLTGQRYQVSPAIQGAGLFKVRNGTPQYLVSLFS